MSASRKDLSIGKKLQKMRKGKKWSMNQLANETGLSIEYLNQVEKGEVIPPVAIILQLSRALEVDSSILLKAEKQKAGKKADQDFQKRTEDYAYQTLTPGAQNKHLKAFKIFIDPQSDHKGVSYQHVGEEFIYVLKGKIQVTVGDNQSILKVGETIHFNSAIIHKLSNISDAQAELLVVLYTP
jgi:transcriptional regulator with XRE-family HTH domain